MKYTTAVILKHHLSFMVHDGAPCSIRIHRDSNYYGGYCLHIHNLESCEVLEVGTLFHDSYRALNSEVRFLNNEFNVE